MRKFLIQILILGFASSSAAYAEGFCAPEDQVDPLLQEIDEAFQPDKTPPPAAAVQPEVNVDEIPAEALEAMRALGQAIEEELMAGEIFPDSNEIWEARLDLAREASQVLYADLRRRRDEQREAEAKPADAPAPVDANPEAATDDPEEEPLTEVELLAKRYASKIAPIPGFTPEQHELTILQALESARHLLVLYEFWLDDEYEDTENIEDVLKFDPRMDARLTQFLNLTGTVGETDLRSALLAVAIYDPEMRARLSAMAAVAISFELSMIELLGQDEYEAYQDRVRSFEEGDEGYLAVNLGFPTHIEKTRFLNTYPEALVLFMLRTGEEFYTEGEFDFEKLRAAIVRYSGKERLSEVELNDITIALESRVQFDVIKDTPQLLRPLTESTYFFTQTPYEMGLAIARNTGLVEEEFYRFSPEAFLQESYPEGPDRALADLQVLLGVRSNPSAVPDEKPVQLFEEVLRASRPRKGVSAEEALEFQRQFERAVDRLSETTGDIGGSANQLKLRDLVNLLYISSRIDNYSIEALIEDWGSEEVSSEIEKAANQLYELEQLISQILDPPPRIIFGDIYELRDVLRSEAVPLLRRLRDKAPGVSLARYHFGGQRPDVTKLYASEDGEIRMLDHFVQYFGQFGKWTEREGTASSERLLDSILEGRNQGLDKYQAQALVFPNWESFLDEAEDMDEHLKELQSAMAEALKASWDQYIESELEDLKEEVKIRNESLSAALKREEEKDEPNQLILQSLRSAILVNENILREEEKLFEEKKAFEFSEFSLPVLESLSFFVLEGNGFNWDSTFLPDQSNVSRIQLQRLRGDDDLLQGQIDGATSLANFIFHLHPRNPVPQMRLFRSTQEFALDSRLDERFKNASPEETLARFPYIANSLPEYLQAVEGINEDRMNRIRDEAQLNRSFYSSWGGGTKGFRYAVLPDINWAEARDFALLTDLLEGSSQADLDHLDELFSDGFFIDMHGLRNSVDGAGEDSSPAQAQLERMIVEELKNLRGLLGPAFAEIEIDWEVLGAELSRATVRESFDYDRFLLKVTEVIRQHHLYAEGGDDEKAAAREVFGAALQDIERLMSNSDTLSSSDDFAKFLSVVLNSRIRYVKDDEIQVIEKPNFINIWLTSEAYSSFKEKVAGLSPVAQRNLILRDLRGSPAPDWTHRIDRRLLRIVEAERARNLRSADSIDIQLNPERHIPEELLEKEHVRELWENSQRAGIAGVGHFAQGATASILRQRIRPFNTLLKFSFLSPEGRSQEDDPVIALREILLRDRSQRRPEKLRIKQDEKEAYLFDMLVLGGVLPPDSEGNEFAEEFIELFNTSEYRDGIREQMSHTSKLFFTDYAYVEKALETENIISRDDLNEINSWIIDDPEFYETFIEPHVLPTQLPEKLSSSEINLIRSEFESRGLSPNINWNSKELKELLGRYRRYVSGLRFFFNPDDKNEDESKREPEYLLYAHLIAAPLHLRRWIEYQSEGEFLPATMLLNRQNGIADLSDGGDDEVIFEASVTQAQVVARRLESLFSLFPESTHSFSIEDLVGAIEAKGEELKPEEIQKFWVAIEAFAKQASEGDYSSTQAYRIRRFLRLIDFPQQGEFMEAIRQASGDRVGDAWKGVDLENEITAGHWRDAFPDISVAEEQRRWSSSIALGQRGLDLELMFDRRVTALDQIIKTFDPEAPLFDPDRLSERLQSIYKGEGVARPLPTRAFFQFLAASIGYHEEYSRYLNLSRDNPAYLIDFLNNYRTYIEFYLPEFIEEAFPGMTKDDLPERVDLALFSEALLEDEAKLRLMNVFFQFLLNENKSRLTQMLKDSGLEGDAEFMSIINFLHDPERASDFPWERSVLVRREVQTKPGEQTPQSAPVDLFGGASPGDTAFSNAVGEALDSTEGEEPEYEVVSETRAGWRTGAQNTVSEDFFFAAQKLAWDFDEERATRDQGIEAAQVNWLRERMTEVSSPWFDGIEAYEAPYLYRPDIYKEDEEGDPDDLFILSSRVAAGLEDILGAVWLDEGVEASDQNLNSENEAYYRIYGPQYDKIFELFSGLSDDLADHFRSMRTITSSVRQLQTSEIQGEEDEFKLEVDELREALAYTVASARSNLELEVDEETNPGDIYFACRRQPFIPGKKMGRISKQEKKTIESEEEGVEPTEVTEWTYSLETEAMLRRCQNLLTSDVLPPLSKQAAFEIWTEYRFENSWDKYGEEGLPREVLMALLRQVEVEIGNAKEADADWQEQIQKFITQGEGIAIPWIMGVEQRLKEFPGHDNYDFNSLMGLFQGEKAAAQLTEIRAALQESLDLANSDSGREQLRELRRVSMEGIQFMLQHEALQARFTYDQNTTDSIRSGLSSIRDFVNISDEYRIPVTDLTEGLAEVSIDEVRGLVQESEALLWELKRRENIPLRMVTATYTGLGHIGEMLWGMAKETGMTVAADLSMGGAGRLSQLGVLDQTHESDLLQFWQKHPEAGYSQTLLADGNAAAFWQHRLINWGSLGFAPLRFGKQIRALRRLGVARGSWVTGNRVVGGIQRAIGLETRETLERRALRLAERSGHTAQRGFWTKERFIFGRPADGNILAEAGSSAIREAAEREGLSETLTRAQWLKQTAKTGAPVGVMFLGISALIPSLGLAWDAIDHYALDNETAFPRNPRTDEIQTGRVAYNFVSTWGDSFAAFVSFFGLHMALRHFSKWQAVPRQARQAFALGSYGFDESMNFFIVRAGLDGGLTMGRVYGQRLFNSAPYQDYLDDPDFGTEDFEVEDEEAAMAALIYEEDKAALAEGRMALQMMIILGAVARVAGSGPKEDMLQQSFVEDMIRIHARYPDEASAVIKRFVEEGHLRQVANVHARQRMGRALSKDEYAALEAHFTRTRQLVEQQVNREMRGLERTRDLLNKARDPRTGLVEANRLTEGVGSRPQELMDRLSQINGETFFFMRRDGRPFSHEGQKILDFEARALQRGELTRPELSIRGESQIFTTTRALEDFISGRAFGRQIPEGPVRIQATTAHGNVSTILSTHYRTHAINRSSGTTVRDYRVQDGRVIRKYQRSDSELSTQMIFEQPHSSGRHSAYRLEFEAAGRRKVEEWVDPDGSITLQLSASRLEIRPNGEVVLKRPGQQSQNYSSLDELLSTEYNRQFLSNQGFRVQRLEEVGGPREGVNFRENLTKKEREDGFEHILRGEESVDWMAPYTTPSGQTAWGRATTTQHSESVISTKLPSGRNTDPHLRVQLETRLDVEHFPRPRERSLHEQADDLVTGVGRGPRSAESARTQNLLFEDLFGGAEGGPQAVWSRMYQRAQNRLSRQRETVTRETETYDFSFFTPRRGQNVEVTAEGIVMTDRRGFRMELRADSDLVRITIPEGTGGVLTRQMRISEVKKMFEAGDRRLFPTEEMFAELAVNYLMRRVPEFQSQRAVTPASEVQAQQLKLWLESLNLKPTGEAWLSATTRQAKLRLIDSRFETLSRSMQSRRGDLSDVQLIRLQDIEFAHRNLRNFVQNSRASNLRGRARDWLLGTERARMP